MDERCILDTYPNMTIVMDRAGKTNISRLAHILWPMGITLVMGSTLSSTEKNVISRIPETNSGKAMVARPKNEIIESDNFPDFTPASTPKKMERGI